jgi:SAM-dependent methyltransferase
MLSFCKARLGELANRVEFVVSNFQQLSHEHLCGAPADVVFSAYSLHHLAAAEKKQLIATSLGFLKPGGWFVNADLVLAGDHGVEQRIQQLRVEGVVSRANGDSRFLTPAATRAFLDQLEQGEKDQPLSLLEDLAIARRAGLESVELFWKEYREAVWGGPKAARTTTGCATGHRVERTDPVSPVLE